MRHDVGHAIATPQQRVAKQATDEAYMNYFGRQRTKTRRKRLLKVLPFFVFLRVVFFLTKRSWSFRCGCWRRHSSRLGRITCSVNFLFLTLNPKIGAYGRMHAQTKYRLMCRWYSIVRSFLSLEHAEGNDAEGYDGSEGSIDKVWMRRVVRCPRNQGGPSVFAVGMLRDFCEIARAGEHFTIVDLNLAVVLEWSRIIAMPLGTSCRLTGDMPPGLSWFLTERHGVAFLVETAKNTGLATCRYASMHLSVPMSTHATAESTGIAWSEQVFPAQQSQSRSIECSIE